MKQLDTYYRALLNFREATTQNRECTAFRKAVSEANADTDSIKIIRTICTVEEDWLDEIEKGLVFVDKAIKEDRQFIYSNGEVEPIEKVKNVSTESVKHLARHSNLITRMPAEGHDIIPDKLYSVERLNDYTVYENRFLYMLLCYVRDFVSIRYSKIMELSNKYDGTLYLDKQITTAKQTLSYRVSLHDERRDDKYLREHNPAKPSIDRMDLILKTIIAFMATPLMEYASKAPMLKPPMTKTNVLKMDNNFKGAVALYDYIIAYDKDGYTKEERIIDLSPFDQALSDELSEGCALLSFLTYEYGLDLKNTLKNRYEVEEQKRRAQEIEQRAEQLEQLKQKLARSEISAEEYIVALEKQVKLMQTDQARIEPMRKEIFELKQHEEELNLQIAELCLNVKKLNEELDEIGLRHAKEMAALKDEYQERIYGIMTQHEQEMRELQQAYDAKIQELHEEIHQIQDKWNQEVAEYRRKLEDSEAKYDALHLLYKTLEEKKAVCEAQIKALRIENGSLNNQEEYVEKDGFDQLEKEFEIFERFYKEQWKQVKKKIRKKTLTLENLRGQKGQETQP